MLKQMIALITFSIIIVFTMAYAHQGLQYLIDLHEWISVLLTEVFSPGHAGMLARGLLTLLSIPLLAGLIPAFIYWLVKRHWFPYFMEIVWVIWLIQVGALVMIYKSV
jgi:hypothetical protein